MNRERQFFECHELDQFWNQSLSSAQLLYVTNGFPPFTKFNRKNRSLCTKCVS